jgi:uncharacterized protein YcnI
MRAIAFSSPAWVSQSLTRTGVSLWQARTGYLPARRRPPTAISRLATRLLWRHGIPVLAPRARLDRGHICHRCGAHVALDENTAEAGSYAVVTFKVPNESDSATTTSITLSLPTDTPFTSVRYIPVAGWQTGLVTAELPEPVMIGDSEIMRARTSVIWTATGDGIADGQLQRFPLTCGPVSDVGSVTLPGEQGYSDGTIVSWSETGEDAGHPAPILYVNDTPAADRHGDGEQGDGDAAGEAHQARPGVLAWVLGGAGLVLGASALVITVAQHRTRASDD